MNFLTNISIWTENKKTGWRCGLSFALSFCTCSLQLRDSNREARTNYRLRVTGEELQHSVANEAMKLLYRKGPTVLLFNGGQESTKLDSFFSSHNYILEVRIHVCRTEDNNVHHQSFHTAKDSAECFLHSEFPT